MKITITKALKELKLSDAKINKAISKLNPSRVLVVGKYQGTPQSAVELNEWKKSQKAILQSVESLIKRRDEIKRKVVLSNALTKIKFPDNEEMTVADAIERKNSIQYMESLVSHLNYHQSNAEDEKLRAVDNSEHEVSNLLNKLVGRETTENKKAIQEKREAFQEMFKVERIDAFDVEKTAETYETKLETFKTEVDDLLAVSNALTLIEIED